MSNLSELVQQGSSSAWFYLPTAVLLGALHGLEPGHSKTMMAAFIIAIRGTIYQAFLLGLCAAFSHSVVIWILAAAALHYGGQISAESAEPYFLMGSAVLILGLALWMVRRTYQEVKAEERHAHEPDHGHDHHDCGADSGERASGSEYRDAHELAHAKEIEQRFTNRPVTNGQIALFGLTGGLLPCPAALTVVLVCLQLKKFTLGILMVFAFSVGLALTLVATGALAAWGLRHATRRFGGFGKIARKLPYLSSALLIAMALYMGVRGWLQLHHAG